MAILEIRSNLPMILIVLSVIISSVWFYFEIRKLQYKIIDIQSIVRKMNNDHYTTSEREIGITMNNGLHENIINQENHMNENTSIQNIQEMINHNPPLYPIPPNVENQMNSDITISPIGKKEIDIPTDIINRNINNNFMETYEESIHDSDNGSDNDSIHGSDNDSIHGSDNDSIHGSDNDSIHGSDNDSIHGSDNDSIHGSDNDSIHGSDNDSECDEINTKDLEDNQLETLNMMGSIGIMGIIEVQPSSPDLSIRELKEICKKNNLHVSGNKSTLVERINNIQK